MSLADHSVDAGPTKDHGAAGTILTEKTAAESGHQNPVEATNAADAERSAKLARNERRHRIDRLASHIGKTFATVGVTMTALLAAILVWQHYVTAPWTRDGTVRVQVANVAPEVSGKIVKLAVSDNQFVKKGDVLYVIDPFDFEVAVRISRAVVQQRAADLQVKQAESARRQHLSDLATTPEQQQIYAGNALQAQAAYEAAAHQLAQAELNLKRTTVISPVNGYVTNLLLRAGNYAATGNSNMAIIDADSFWIDGYFEETKMANVCVGSVVRAQLVGYPQPIRGHVETVTRGISPSNAAPGTQGLPAVDPIYTWVRLAQRVPVRIAIDAVPTGVPLVSGMTATVTLDQPTSSSVQWLDRMKTMIIDPIADFFGNRPPSRQDCIQDISPARPQAQTIPSSTEPSIPPLKEIVPALQPSVDDH